MRKLATLKMIKDIKDIENADRIEVAVVDRWECIVGKHEYKIGDVVVFIEPDSLIPKDIKHFNFLDKYCKTKTINNKEYYLVGTTKLRGQISQGVLLKLNDLNNIIGKEKYNMDDIGEEVTDDLGIIKYSPSEVDGSNIDGCFLEFPYFIRKTDEERIQNLDYIPEDEYEITEKLDGTSCTIFKKDGGGTRICSRNKEIIVDELPTNNIYRKIYDRYNNLALDNIAIQGEIIGPKIQKNPYKLDDVDFYVFNLYDINKQEYILGSNKTDRKTVCENLGFNHVPIINNSFHFSNDYDSLMMSYSKGKSLLNPDINKEGVVLKSLNREFSFKIINTDYLLNK